MRTSPKKILTALLALCLAVCLVIPMTASAEEQNPTIKIGDTTYPTIQQAIDAAKAEETIELSAGTFTIQKELAVDKALTITGAGKGKTTIVYDSTNGNPTQVMYLGDKPAYPIVHATAALTMSGLTVKGPTDKHHGIDGIYSTASLTLTNMAITDIRCTADGGDICGVQYGRPVIVEGTGTDTTAHLNGVDLIHFQKQAIDVSGLAGILVENTKIQGYGAQAVITQNAMVIRNSYLTAANNTISDMVYNADNEWKNGSIGIYLLGKSGALVGGNTFKNVDNAFYGDKDTEFIFSTANSLTATKEFESTDASNHTYMAWSIALDKTSAKLTAGETLPLKMTVTPSNADDTYTWASSDEKVATVDENGKVTAVAPGKATITVTSYLGVQASCEVTVADPAKPEIDVVVTPEKPAETVSKADAEAANKVISQLKVENLYGAVDVKEINAAVAAGKDVQVELKVSVAAGTKLSNLQADETPVLVFEAAPYFSIDGGEAVKIDNAAIKKGVTLYLPLPEGFPTENLVVVHSTGGMADETLTPVIVVKDGVSYAKITVTHFSTFKVMQKAADTSTPSTPNGSDVNTGDSFPMASIGLLLVLGGAGAAVTLRRRRSK